MAKLYFKYGAMGSSKTAQALITKYNYEENDLSVWLLKPSADTRDGKSILRSRIGLEAEVEIVPPETDILEPLDMPSARQPPETWWRLARDSCTRQEYGRLSKERRVSPEKLWGQ